METTYLNPDQIPAHFKTGYPGKKFKARVTETVAIPSHAGLWDGGSRDTYTLVEIATGKTVTASDNYSAPWDDDRKSRNIALKPGYCVVQHTIFCGKDLGLTFHMLASDVAPMLPAPTDKLTRTESIVLAATRSFKASYNGQDRYSMSQDDMSYREQAMPSRDEWDAAKVSLIEKKLLNKAGAITTAGKNAIGRTELRDCT